MRKVAVLALAAVLTPVATARVWTSVYRCDGKTPLEAVDPNHLRAYRDIMVGTRLSLVVSSDTGGYWNGILMLSWDDWDYGTLSARSHSKTTVDPDSELETALDFRGDGRIDAPDLALFSEYWRERTDRATATAEPNEPAKP